MDFVGRTSIEVRSQSPLADFCHYLPARSPLDSRLTTGPATIAASQELRSTLPGHVGHGEGNTGQFCGCPLLPSPARGPHEL